MQWNLRLRAAERGIWKSAQLRRMLADAGLEISAGKMSSWWAGTPPTMRLEELDVLCSVLECTPNDLMSPSRTRSPLAGPELQMPPTAATNPRARTATAEPAAAHLGCPLGSARHARRHRCSRRRPDALNRLGPHPGPGPNAPLRLPPSATAARSTASHGPAPASTSATSACPAAPSHRHSASAAAATTATSARACAAGAIPAAPSTSTPARAAWPGASTRATTGPAGRASGGRGTTPRASASSADAQAMSASKDRADCAWRMPDSSNNPAAHLMSPARTGTASSSSSPTWSSSVA